ncbi:MAG: efflux RND transporter periplasmic adaptor subunit [Myxococcota bacterium]
MFHASKITGPALRLALGSTLLLAGLVGCGSGGHEEHERAELEVTRPLRRDTEITREYVAQIHAIQHIELRAMERGYLDDILVDEGQFVKKGQKMFQIMPTLYKAELQKAVAEAEFAEIEYKNTQSLAERDVVSPNELALAKATLDKAKAELSLARAHLDLTDIRAPFDGIMNRLEVRRGSLLEEGELLTLLSDNSDMWVYFNVTEAEYLDFKMQMSRDQPIPVKLQMANGKLFPEIGRVETIEADFNNETGNIAFRATFPNPSGLLRHGETGKVLMPSALEDALLVPQKATFDILDKRYVFVIDDEGVAHQREISVAQELPHVYVVDEGLEDDERILLEGLRKVRDGMEVASRFEEPEEVFAQLQVPAE